jgi:hypothetical protein
VSSSRSTFRNSSADENVCAVKPEAFSNPFVASQIDGIVVDTSEDWSL